MSGMHGASREALAAARERLDALTDSTSVDAGSLADELAAVTALLHREVSLRRVLTDPAQSGEAKAELAQRLLGTQVSGTAVDLVAGTVRSRWSQSRDLVDALEQLANIADLTAAQKRGRLDNVEDELFRFGRIISSNTELRAALTSRSATTAAKSELLAGLLGSRAERTTERLVTRLSPRRGDVAWSRDSSPCPSSPPTAGPDGRRGHLGGAAERHAEAAPRRGPREGLRPSDAPEPRRGPRGPRRDPGAGG